MIRTLLTSFLLFITLTSPAFSYFEIKVFKVGEGNCIVAKTWRTSSNTYEYMVVDCGTTEFTKSFKVEENVSQGSSPEEKNKFTNGQLFSEKKEERQKEKVIRNIIDFFSPSNKDEKITIKTFFVTHPDKDHCSWVNDVFPEESFEIQNIVLGGLPEKYTNLMLNKKVPFQQWLKAHKGDNTKIYFMGLKGFDLDGFMPNEEELDVKFEALKKGEYRFAPQVFSDPQKKNFLIDGREFEQKVNFLDFGANTKVSLLSVNPTHEQDFRNTVLRHNYRGKDADDNAESLVIKIENLKTSKSALLMGDATGITTRRIVSNYLVGDLKIDDKDTLFFMNEKDEKEIVSSDKYKFFSTNLVVGAHHGSSTHDSNDLMWILLTQPEYVFLSSGLKYNHPTQEVFETFQKSPKLKKQVNQHKVIFGIKNIKVENKKEEDDDSEELEDKDMGKILEAPYVSTTNGIFSTLSNGDLLATFTDEKDKYKQLEISCLLLKDEKLDKVDVSDREEENEKNYSIASEALPSPGTSTTFFLTEKKKEAVVEKVKGLFEETPQYTPENMSVTLTLLEDLEMSVTVKADGKIILEKVINLKEYNNKVFVGEIIQADKNQKYKTGLQSTTINLLDQIKDLDEPVRLFFANGLNNRIVKHIKENMKKNPHGNFMITSSLEEDASQDANYKKVAQEKIDESKRNPTNFNYYSSSAYNDDIIAFSFVANLYHTSQNDSYITIKPRNKNREITISPMKNIDLTNPDNIYLLREIVSTKDYLLELRNLEKYQQNIVGKTIELPLNDEKNNFIIEHIKVKDKKYFKEEDREKYKAQITVEAGLNAQIKISKMIGVNKETALAPIKIDFDFPYGHYDNYKNLIQQIIEYTNK